MEQKFYYLLLLIPILLADAAIFFRYQETLRRYKKTIVTTIVIFVIWYFVVDPLAVQVWKIWFYDIGKILNIWVFGTVIEELIWVILVTFLFACWAVVSIEKNKKIKDV